MDLFSSIQKYFFIIFCLFIKVEKLEDEVGRWRSGETVRPEEQVNLVEIEAVTPVTSFIEEKPPVAVSVFAIIIFRYNTKLREISYLIFRIYYILYSWDIIVKLLSIFKF